MGTTVQARLDKETSAEMDAFLSRTGWSTSKAVREAIRLLIRGGGAAGRPFKIHGLGEFDSGITDLASNKKHLRGFGKKRRPASVVVRKASGR
jgi:antitoxin component of RelBE/YafQ-DinJ toxin-antitoxin module